jgi:hypothetical protein
MWREEDEQKRENGSGKMKPNKSKTGENFVTKTVMQHAPQQKQETAMHQKKHLSSKNRLREYKLVEHHLQKELQKQTQNKAFGTYKGHCERSGRSNPGCENQKSTATKATLRIRTRSVVSKI